MAAADRPREVPLRPSPSGRGEVLMQRTHSRSARIPLLVVGTVLTLTGAFAGTAQAGLPSAATKVAVTADATSSGTDAHLTPAARISGTVKSTSGAPLQAIVSAYHQGRYVGGAYTDGGVYHIDGLSPGSYAICVSSFSVITSSPTGFLGRCYKSAPFISHVPASATQVTVTSGQQKSGVNLSLPAAAGISGKVTGSGHALGDVYVYLHNRSTGQDFFGSTAGTGTFRITGLTAAAKGYSVCFNALAVTSGTGFVPRCFKSTPWSGMAPYPSGSTPVPVTLGHVHGGVDQALLRGGAVSGVVTDAKTGKAVSGLPVEVYGPSGRFLRSSFASPKGAYRIDGLAAASQDHVCVFPYGSRSDPSTTYHGQCWKAVPWNGGKVPAAAKPVTVKIGRTHTGLSFRLGKTVVSLGSIAGTVTELTGGMPLQQATVNVYSGGNFVTEASTDSAGAYTASNLRPGTYQVCVYGTSAFGPTPPATGWAPRCYHDVAWDGSSVPTSANGVSVAPGQHRTGIDVALRDGGAVSGTVTDAGTAADVVDVQVEVFTPGGRFIASAFSGLDGTYDITGLSPKSYVVCFDGRSIGGPGYVPQCYRNVAWDGSF